MVTRPSLAVLIIAASLTAPAYADKASDAYKHGLEAEKRAHLDEAFGYYKQAYNLSPHDGKYFAAFARVRFSAAQQHLRAAQLLRNMGSLPEALAEFQKAADIDNSNIGSQEEVRRTADMIRRKEQQKDKPKVESPLAKLADDAAESIELQPLSNAAISFRMTANADVAYKTIGKLAGLNVIIDPDLRPQKITVELTDVTAREALDLIRLQSKTFWRPVLPNTIFVAADSAAKRKEVEQNIMKTFYLQNISTPNELQEAANMVKQILDISRIQLLQAQDAIIVRGTPDQLILAEKLLADYDKPKPEVVIDVAVMEVSRDKIRTIGNVLPTSVSAAILPSGGAIASTGSTTSGSSSSSSGGALTLNTGGVNGIGSFAVAIPSSATFTFLASDSNSKVLQNPQIRALNNEKSTLRIGDRVPIATGSFQPGIVGGGGVSPLVSTQFQYLDVGVNIDITPHIHSDREVTLKMSLEISSVTGSESIGGITQPIIGQRRIDHEARLADGEVNLLGGILNDTETQSMSGYPWVSRIPILKYLFAQDNRERREDEIIFAITPHIIRAKDVTEENLRAIDVGTGSSTELRRKAAKQQAATQTPAPAAPAPAAPAGAARPAATAPANPQAPGAATPAGPAGAPRPAATTPATPQAPGVATPAGPAGAPRPAAATPASPQAPGAAAPAGPQTPAATPAGPASAPRPAAATPASPQASGASTNTASARVFRERDIATHPDIAELAATGTSTRPPASAPAAPQTVPQTPAPGTAATRAPRRAAPVAAASETAVLNLPDPPAQPPAH
jgi:general secretion pathway protein D